MIFSELNTGHEGRDSASKQGPQRTCVGCRQVDSQRALIRVTRNDKSLCVNVKRRLFGRGAYVHASSSCLTRAEKGGWNRSFKASISKNSFTELREQILNMRSEGSYE